MPVALLRSFRRRSNAVALAVVCLPLLGACARGASADAADEAPPVAEGGASSLPPEGDAGADAPADAPARDAHASDADAPCTATMALVAGDGAGVFAATFHAGAWSPAEALDGSMTSVPALVASGASYVGVLRGTGDALAYTRAANGAWSSLAPVSAATTAGAPTLVDVSGTAHLVYLGTNTKFYHGTFAAGAWDAANDPVGGAASQSFGSSPPTGAAGASGFTIVQAGSDAKLYAQAWSAGWGAALPAPVSAYALTTASPRVAALTPADALVVYPHSDGLLMYGVLGSSAWKPVLTAVYDTTGAAARSSTTVSLAPLPNGGAVLVYVDDAGKPWFSLYAPGATPPWTTPQAFPAAAVGSTPQVARGVCGDDAVAVYTTPGAGGARVVSLRAGAWTAPVTVGASSATYAAIATQP